MIDNNKKEKIKNSWKFILDQITRCNKRIEEKNYRDTIDLIYDIAGNISNLYWFIEYGQASTDKSKILNNLSIMFRSGIFSKDYGLFLREKWDLRNIAKYGYFASSKLDIKDIEIHEKDVSELFDLIKDLVEEFEKYLKKKDVKIGD